MMNDIFFFQPASIDGSGNLHCPFCASKATRVDGRDEGVGVFALSLSCENRHRWGLYIGEVEERLVVRYILEKLEKHSKPESPIEEMFWELAENAIVGIRPQYRIGRYRVDFAIAHRKMVIELDGHDYHKTKEQRTNDASRERYLMEHGWQVIRFTGSEVYKDVVGCVNQANRILGQ